MTDYYCVNDSLDIVKISISKLEGARFFTRSIFQIEEGVFDFDKTVFISEEDALSYVIDLIKLKINCMQDVLTEHEQRYENCKKEEIIE